jgi:hypothetical protein
MKDQQKRLSVLSNLEQLAFYSLPDFDPDQRSKYFTFEKQEIALIESCSTLQCKIYCALQIGYFKAKNTFFKFFLNKIPQADVSFISVRYFNNQALSFFNITRYEHYFQRQEISRLFGYKLWSNGFLHQIYDHGMEIVRRDMSPNFLANELLSFLKGQRIVRPGYTTLQDIVSHVLSQERVRLKAKIQDCLIKQHRNCLDQLFQSENALSELASIKQDAKNFGAAMMGRERQKHHTLKPLYQIAKEVLPHLNISQQNIAHYASLASHYSIYELGRFDEEQAYLYLLCYAFKRYQQVQVNDTLVDGFQFQVKKLESSIKEKATSNLVKDSIDKQIGRLLLLYVDDNLSDSLTLGETRKIAFEILPKDSIRSAGENILRKRRYKLEAQWKERDKAAPRYKRHLRSLFSNIDFSSLLKNNPLLEAIEWMKKVFGKHQTLLQQSPETFPTSFISKRLKPYLVSTDKDGKSVIDANRYEILIYRQIVKQLLTGAIHVEDSIRHRTFYHELAPLDEKEAILKTLDIPWLKKSCQAQLDSLFKELDDLLGQANYSLYQGKLKHLKYDHMKKKIVWLKPKSTDKMDEKSQQMFYEKLPIREIVDVLRFVNKETGFLSSLTPLKPRYNKQKIDEDHLIAVIVSQAMGIGNYKMSQTSDIPYSVLETTYAQYMRLSTLKKAHDDIANAMILLGIFPYYTFDLDVLYGSVDGQKYETITPTARARYSRKYYKKGRGVVAYTLLSNHVPLQTEIIGAHEHESHFVFDIWYGNTSLINPSVLTGDMHSIKGITA